MARNKMIGINVTAEEREIIKNRADSIGLSISTYCRLVLKEWVESENTLSLNETK